MGSIPNKLKSFTLYTDLKPIIDRLPEDPMLKAMYDYVCTGKQGSFDDEFSQLVWDIIKIKLDASIEYHNNAVESGRKGGLAKAQKEKTASKRRDPKGALATLNNPKEALATRQDRTGQDCPESQPGSSSVGGLTAEGEEEFDITQVDFDD